MEEVPSGLYAAAINYSRTDSELSYQVIRKAIIKNELLWAMQDEVIDSIEGTSLLQMVNSSDDESFELAAMIIINRMTAVKFE